MKKTTEPYRGTIARRMALQTLKINLESMIRNSLDPIAVGKLRADYREVMDEIDLYYTDELEGKSHD